MTRCLAKGNLDGLVGLVCLSNQVDERFTSEGRGKAKIVFCQDILLNLWENCS